MARYLEFDRNTGMLKEVTPVTTSSGAADANKIPQLNAAGKLDVTLMPPEIGVEAITYVAAETISAGNLVNIYYDSTAGGVRVRRASNDNNQPAHAFALESGTTGSNVRVMTDGIISGLTGLTPGKIYFLGTAGGLSNDPPTQSGRIAQSIGYAINSTELVFDPDTPIVIA